VNPLALNAAELDALRDLQAGTNHLDADDPIWDALEDLRLVELRYVMRRPGGSLARTLALTAYGRSYPAG
jgi:hypothetical protein